jgi:hypothetical protein
MRAPLSLLVLALSLFGIVACSSKPPAAWASGGARLALGNAIWKLGEDDVTMDRGGRVSMAGDTQFSIDVAGRVYDDDGDPAAVLLPDGNVVGNDNVHLGRVGVTNASPPGAETAWLTLSPGGDVILFDSDGERHSGGRWTGCTGAVLRTCTLVTHLALLSRATAEQNRTSVGLGVGVGIYR